MNATIPPGLKKLTGSQIVELKALRQKQVYTPETVLALVRRFPVYPDIGSADKLAPILKVPASVIDFLRKALARLPFVFADVSSRGAVRRIDFRRTAPGYVIVGINSVSVDAVTLEGPVFSMNFAAPFSPARREELVTKYKALAEEKGLVFVDGREAFFTLMGQLLSDQLNAYIDRLEVPARLKAKLEKMEIESHG